MNTLLLVATAACLVFILTLMIGLNLTLRPRKPVTGPFSIAPLPEKPLDYGLGLETFECPEWRHSGGACCPAGAVRLSCPGLRTRCSLVRMN